VYPFVPTLETSGEFVRFKTKGFNYKDLPPYRVTYCFYRVIENITWWHHYIYYSLPLIFSWFKSTA